ncbi:MAG: stage II sporulation protein M, partial [Caldimonas sp.]
AMFGHYIRNNVGIAFQCFAGGLFFGIGSLVTLALNGIMAGSVAGYLTSRGDGQNFYSFVVTHGAFELTAIVLAGAAGLVLGRSLLAPGRRTRLAALQQAARQAIVLVYGITAMLFVAAALEAFWSSARWVEPNVKFAVGGACWVAVIAYFVFQGRPRRE